MATAAPQVIRIPKNVVKPEGAATKADARCYGGGSPQGHDEMTVTVTAMISITITVRALGRAWTLLATVHVGIRNHRRASLVVPVALTLVTKRSKWYDPGSAEYCEPVSHQTSSLLCVLPPYEDPEVPCGYGTPRHSG